MGTLFRSANAILESNSAFIAFWPTRRFKNSPICGPSSALPQEQENIPGDLLSYCFPQSGQRKIMTNLTSFSGLTRTVGNLILATSQDARNVSKVNLGEGIKDCGTLFELSD